MMQHQHAGVRALDLVEWAGGTPAARRPADVEGAEALVQRDPLRAHRRDQPVTRQAEGLLKYFLVVTNLQNYPVTFQARYDVLGWGTSFK